MKKAAMTLFVAAVASGLWAKDPYVYEVTMKVKTTVAKTGKVSTACQVIGTTSSNKISTVTFRKQGTVTVKGLIWGCECDSFAGELGFTSPSDDGCYFWNVTDRRALKNGKVTWPVFNRIDKNMKKAEGTMELFANGWHLLCGGFGRAVDVTDAIGRLNMLKGNFGGWRMAPTWSYTVYGEPCTFCDSGTADVTYEEAALAWAICQCAAATDKTTAFGTWNIKYNGGLANRLREATAITSVYSFPSYVTAAMGIKPEPAETPAAE